MKTSLLASIHIQLSIGQNKAKSVSINVLFCKNGKINIYFSYIHTQLRTNFEIAEDSSQLSLEICSICHHFMLKC